MGFISSVARSGYGEHSPAHTIFQQQTAWLVVAQRAAHVPSPAQLVSPETDVPLGQISVPHRHASGDEFLEKARKQLREDFRATGEQEMRMAALRRSPSFRRTIGQRIALYYCDGVVEVGKYSGREQSTHARSQHHRVCRGTFHKSS
jgi:hypothetical protein